MENKFERLQGLVPEQAEGQQEEIKERIETAKNALLSHLALKPDEKIIIIHGAESNSEIISIMEKAAQATGAACEIFVADKSRTRKDLLEKLKTHKVILDFSWKQYKTTDNLYDKDLADSGARLICFADSNEKLFDKNGAMSENLAEMKQRMSKMENELNKAKGFRITSVYGTNLEIPLRPFGERNWYKCTGVVAEPGKWDNWPGGEVFSSQDDFRQKKSGRKIIDEGRFNLL